MDFPEPLFPRIPITDSSSMVRLMFSRVLMSLKDLLIFFISIKGKFITIQDLSAPKSSVSHSGHLVFLHGTARVFGDSYPQFGHLQTLGGPAPKPGPP